jgi:nucleotide-binding universal stress UspA family protein
MKHIILPTDFSEESIQTIKNAKILAAKLDKSIRLLYIIDYSQYANLYQEPMEVNTVPFAPALQELQEIGEELYKKHREEIENIAHPEIEVNYEIKPGVFPHVLVQESKDEDVYMIVLSKGKEEGFLTKFFDNTNEEIMSEAACPVLIMNEKITLDSIENILYATNYHKEDIPSMKKLSELASIYDAEITALHITRDKDFDDRLKSGGFSDTLKKEAGYKKLLLKLVEGKDAADEIIKYSRENNMDLIALLKENKGFLKEIFSGSSTREVLHEAKIPVLVFHQKSFIK